MPNTSTNNENQGGTFSVTPHSEYTFIKPEIEKIDACLKGSVFVKSLPELLPHPSMVDITSKKQSTRYKTYVAGAEYDNFPKTTMLSMLGKMKIDDMNLNLPKKINYLCEDVDGDGLSIKGLVDSTARNVLKFKWHILLADYKGMTDLDLQKVSMKDYEEAKPRASIKQYSRQHVIDWHFSRRKGRNQLVYLVLREVGEEFSPQALSRTAVESYLVLGVDEKGYYQAKVTKNPEGEHQMGERNYMTVAGKNLDFIPYEIISDEEFKGGAMPEETGFLSILTDLALARYRVSADYKEALSSLKPTLNVFGINNTEWEQFKETNKRDYIASGALTPNIWSNENAKIELVESSQSLQQFEGYFERNEKKVRALGGVFETEKTGNRTATEVINEAEGQTAILAPMVNSIEAGLYRVILYCGMFEGIYSVEDITANKRDFELSLTRDFAVRKLSVEEVKELREQYLAGLLPKEEYFKVLSLGGWTISAADELLKKIELEAPPALMTPPAKAKQTPHKQDKDSEKAA